MLAGEIEPFAQAHIKAIQEIRAEIRDELSPGPTDSTETLRERMERWEETLRTTERGFYRFQVCMIDEHKMKDRLYNKAEHCRLHHRDK